MSVFYFFYLMIFFILKVESGLRRWCEITARCGDVEFEISKDKIESFELRKPHIVLTDQWRIRKQLWMMLFAIQEFNKSISEKETTEDDSSFITNHSTLLYIINFIKPLCYVKIIMNRCMKRFTFLFLL